MDLAAGELIVKEAGGNILTSKIRKENGEEGINVIAGNGEVVKLVYNKINEVYKYF